MSLISKLKKNRTIKLVYLHSKHLMNKVFGEKRIIERKFQSRNGYFPNIDNPVKYNEKIEWLKLYYFEPFYRKCCDKYLIHEYLIEKFGEDYAVPVLFVCQSVDEFSLDKINEYPCILKVSNANAENIILNSKDEYSEKELRKQLKMMMRIGEMQAITLGETQYLPDGEYIMAEKLVTDPINGIPNDYKLLYINGELQFVYCSIERLKRNYRQIYSPNWEKLPFIWVPNANEELLDKFYNLPSINPPKHFGEMKKIAEKIAKDFPTVRVDFYDTEDEFYIGEITIHHGSGFDRFYPDEYDEFYGKKLALPTKNRNII